MKQELEEKISEETEKMKKVIENFDDYKVVVSNYENAARYPTIYYTDEEGKRHVEHLSIKKPNVLWLKEDPIKKGQRGDASVMQFIKSAEKIGGMVYVQKKKGR